MAASNTNRWKLGLFVTLGAGLSVGSLMWLGISQLQRRTTPAYFYFAESVDGLEIGSTVEFMGVELGRVEEIFPAADHRHIEVRAGIYVDTLDAWGILPSRDGSPFEGRSQVAEDIRGQLVRGALTSVAFIELEHYNTRKYPQQTFTFPVPPETIGTVPSAFKSLEEDLSLAFRDWPALTASAVRVLDRLDAGLAAMDFETLNREAVQSLAAAESMIKRIGDSALVDDESPLLRSVTRVLDDLHVLTSQLAGSGGDLERAVTSFSLAADAFRKDFEDSDIPAAVAAVHDAGTGFAGNSEQFGRLLFELRGSLKELNGALAAIRQVSDVIARDPGSLLHGRTPFSPFKKRSKP